MEELKSVAIPPTDADEQPRTGLIENLIAGGRYLWNRGPRFAAGKGWQAVHLAFSLKGHAAAVKLLSRPYFEPLRQRRPRLPFKYLGAYIAVNLPIGVKRQILIAHYEFLERRFQRSFLDALLDDPPVLWHELLDGRAFRVCLDFPYSDYEGDLRLRLTMDGVEIYRLICAFGPGAPLGAGHGTVLVVTNIQGAQDFDLVKAATKACLDVQPAHLLMAALSGLAAAAQVSQLVGFHETSQISRGRELFFSYDKFFMAYGGERLNRHMYRVRLPYAEKPVTEVKSNHRHRTLRKRQFKAGIREAVAAAVNTHLK